MKFLTFDVGDTVYAHGNKPQTFKLKLFPWPRMVPDYTYQSTNEMSEGKVVLEFQRHEQKYYVVEFQTHIDPVLQVYDGITLSDDPKKPIGFWRR